MRSKLLDYAQWGVVLVGAAAALVLPLVGHPVVLALMLTVPFAFMHGVRRYGWKLFLAFFVVSNGFENFLTGFPFGHYHYTGSFKLFHVPIFIGPIYLVSAM